MNLSVFLTILLRLEFGQLRFLSPPKLLTAYVVAVCACTSVFETRDRSGDGRGRGVEFAHGVTAGTRSGPLYCCA